MLYLNSVANHEASRGIKVVLARRRQLGMQCVPELTPSEALQSDFEAGKLSWEEYRERFLAEMRQEFSKPQSRLKRLAEFSLVSDVTLHSDASHTAGTFREILAEIVNGIWKRRGSELEVIDLAPPTSEPESVTESPTDPLAAELVETASECEHYSPHNGGESTVSCEHCTHYVAKIYACPLRRRLFVDPTWEAPGPAGDSPE